MQAYDAFRGGARYLVYLAPRINLFRSVVLYIGTISSSEVLCKKLVAEENGLSL
jgi:hypothetical protein